MAFGRRRLLQNPPRYGSSSQKGLSAALPFRAVSGAAKGIRQWGREACLGVARGPGARGGSRGRRDHAGAYCHRNGKKMAGVGTQGALRRGVSRKGGVLHLWRDRGGLDGVHKANCRKGDQAVLLFLRRCPLRAQVAEQGAYAFRSASILPIAAISPSRKCPYISVYSSVAGCPSSPAGTRKRRARSTPLKVIEA